MKGFSKIVFAEDGPVAVSCPSCGGLACFCSSGLVALGPTNAAAMAAPLAAAPEPNAGGTFDQAMARQEQDSKTDSKPHDSSAVTSSPALSSLSVSVAAEKSPLFSFQPITGYGTTSPPPFSLGGPASDAGAAATGVTSFFDGGSPTWLFYGTTFAISATGTPQGELRKLIERHGGFVSQTVHKKVDLLVVSHRAVQRNTQKVRKARDKFAIPLVLTTFVNDSVASGEWCAVEDYAPDGAASAQTTNCAIATQGKRFRWKKAIRQVLHAASTRTMRLKHLRRCVLTEYLAQGMSVEPTAFKREFCRKFKQLKRQGHVAVDGSVVRPVGDFCELDPARSRARCGRSARRSLQGR